MLHRPPRLRSHAQTMARATCGVVLWALSATATQAQGNAVVKLDQPTHSIGEPVVVTILNGPPSAAKSQLELARDGKRYDVKATYDLSAGATGVATAESLVANNPATPLALGRYTVQVRLDGQTYPLPATQSLEIVPPGNPALHLDKFSPSATDVVQHADNSPLRVVDLTLRGTGFQVGDHASENVVSINGSLRQDVAWSADATADCLSTSDAPTVTPPTSTTAATTASTKAHTIGATAVNSQEVHLCGVPVPVDGHLLVRLGVGDRVSEPQLFIVYASDTASVAALSALIAAILALVPVAMLAAMAGGYRTGGNRQMKLMLLFLDPETDTYSLSKLQFYLWTLAALFAYAYLFISKVFVQGGPWPDVPGTLPGIIAVSAGTAVGSQIVTGAKGSKGAGAPNPSISDLIMSGGVVAADRVQMLLWTLAGVAGFIVSSLHYAPGVIPTLPAVPQNLLYLMGLSSAGYLGGKMARKAGPVINELSIQPSAPESALVDAAIQTEQPDLRPATAQARADLAALTALGSPASTPATTAVAALTQAIQAAAAAQTSADLDALVQGLITQRLAAEGAAVQAADAYPDAPDPAKAATALDARTAQQAATALQDFSAAVTQAIAQAAATPLQALVDRRAGLRTLTIRGTSLSPDGLFSIDHEELPFRMLVNAQGQQQPDILVRDDTVPTFAKLLKLTIDPERLDEADRRQFDRWFATDGHHVFTLTNLDGQKADLEFSLPPGAGQKPTGSN